MAGKLSLAGLSVAGIETAIEVPSMGLMLDLGRCTRSAVNLPIALISHGHLDHLGALVLHAARRNLLKMREPTYLVPATIAEDVQRLFNAAGALDGQVIPRRIVALDVGQAHDIDAQRYVRPFATVHPVPSQGYTLWERRHRLKAVFRGRPASELAALRKQGIELDEPYDAPLLSFTGDTSIEALERVDELQRVETFVTEVTFLDERVPPADARMMGHIHLDDFLQRRDWFPKADVVFCHFSARYESDEIAQILARRLPDEWRARVRPLLGRQAAAGVR